MTEPNELRPWSQQMEEREHEVDAPVKRALADLPSNEVYARVGDAVLRTAQEGVRSHRPVEVIIREIRAAHGVRLNVGELRLLLASRRI